MNQYRFTKITRASYFIEMIEVLNQANQNSLVLFDVDSVLIMGTDKYRLTHPYRRKWVVDSKTRLSAEKRNFLLSIILEKREVRLVDPYITNILNGLGKRQIATAALTKLYTGQYGVIEDFTNWRIKELNAININFLTVTPIKEAVEINELQIGYGIPMMKEGIIFTANVDKSIVLEHILHQKNYYPKSIIFIDDILDNLESLQRMCAKLQINFHGFEFVGASQIPEPELNEQTEKIRFEILEKEHSWLTDQELKLYK